MAQDFFHLLLDYFQITEEEYRYLNEPVSLDNFTDGYSFKNIDKAVELAKVAIKNKDRILIYGDYDADGIMGTSILVKTFKHLSYDVSYYIWLNHTGSLPSTFLLVVDGNFLLYLVFSFLAISIASLTVSMFDLFH